MPDKPSLSELIDNPDDYLQQHSREEVPIESDDEAKLADNSKPAQAEGFCVECEDQPYTIFCQQCSEDFCDVCFQALHRKGKRKQHAAKKLVQEQQPEKKKSFFQLRSSDKQADIPDEAMTAEEIIEQQSTVKASRESMAERAKWIPVRLSLKERKVLRLLEAALTVSEYTDKVDIVTYRSNKAQRMVAQIKDLCAILCGLVVASDYPTGQDLIKDKDFKFNEDFFKRVFEIGRRHKVMNPEKMRTTYGKLVYLLMDAMGPEVLEMLEFETVAPLRTVYVTLEATGALKMLDDALVETATMEIVPDGKNRSNIQREIRAKERAIEALAKKYSNSKISDDDIRTCLYSIGDNSSFLRGNRDPIDKMIQMLKKYFSPDKAQPTLAISSGKGGARLTHSHQRQYYYVLQSMTLWREINHNMFKLWCLADEDMLDPSSGYRLRDTGQGLNRIQTCPRVSREIHRILSSVMNEIGNGNWVGSSVVHLGDHNVPNALMFIDKYTQVARILAPIVLCIEKIDAELVKDAGIAQYIERTFGSVQALKEEILADFFRHGFDGSGADNFFDAGSCIDGRLTSAWNWCHNIEKKRYFPVFLLTGFIGFDGEFN